MCIRDSPLIYALLFGMPGTPALYYGSEWGISGEKAPCSDAGLRPALEKPEWNALTSWIARLAAARRGSPALREGSYRNVLLTNLQLIFERRTETERVLVAVNADSQPYTCLLYTSCNPIAQAELLNRVETQFNICLGLCVGHDSLFYRYSQAPVTTLVAKDRATGNNPVAAIYCADSYFKTRLDADQP